MIDKQQKPIIIKSIRDQEDRDLYRVVISNYKPLQSVLRLQVNIGTRVAPNCLIATIYAHSDLKEQHQKNNAIMPIQQLMLGGIVSGSIQKIGRKFILKNNFLQYSSQQVERMIQLFYIRACDHEFSQNNVNQQSFQLCILCNQQIWTYFQKREINITVTQLMNYNQSIRIKDIMNIQWSVNLNQQINSNSTIAETNNGRIKLPYNGKITYLWNKNNNLQSDTVLIKYKKRVCRHEKIIRNHCQYCNTQISRYETQQYYSYLFQMKSQGYNGVMSKGAILKEEQDNFIKRIIYSKKLILILDLDNTILHASTLSQLTPSNLKNLKDYYIMPMKQTALNSEDVYVVKMRPYFKQFIQKIIQHYQIYVYTKGTRQYAFKILKWIRAQYAGQQCPDIKLKMWQQTQYFLKDSEAFKPYRFISRNQDMSMTSKSLKNILPNHTQCIVILDDNSDVWKESAFQSLVKAKPYIYFQQSAPINKTNIQPEGQIQNELLKDLYYNLKKKKQSFRSLKNAKSQDYYLVYAMSYLLKIHKQFFETNVFVHEQPVKFKLSVPNINKSLNQFLRKKKVRLFQNIQNQQSLRTKIQNTGGIIIQKQNQAVDFIFVNQSFLKTIRQNQENNAIKQFKQYQNKGTIIHSLYLYLCQTFHHKFDMKPFKIMETQDKHKIDINKIVKQKASIILKSYRQKQSKKLQMQQIISIPQNQKIAQQKEKQQKISDQKQQKVIQASPQQDKTNNQINSKQQLEVTNSFNQLQKKNIQQH